MLLRAVLAVNVLTVFTILKLLSTQGDTSMAKLSK